MSEHETRIRTMLVQESFRLLLIAFEKSGLSRRDSSPSTEAARRFAEDLILLNDPDTGQATKLMLADPEGARALLSIAEAENILGDIEPLGYEMPSEPLELLPYLPLCSWMLAVLDRRSSL